jgi:hypothetical protein
MAKGKKCPHCGRSQLKYEGSYDGCAACGFVGWYFSHHVAKVGKGRGKTCAWCGHLTLHDIVALPHGEVVRRCATCNYVAIDPAPSES